LSRFCDIRGTPKTVVTDNQPSFHKTDKDLHDWIASLDWQQIEAETGMGFKHHSYGITWIFNPPYAPHFGGIFETIVKATKRALAATITKADLTEDEFRTVVYAVMSRLNDRPIAIIGQEKEDLSPLTPNCFLMSHMGYALLPPNNIDKKQIAPRDRWKYVLEIRNHFWKRFSSEIVPLLRTRSKWSHEKENIEIDDVVLEFSENSPRHSWKMLRISKVYPSEDGLVRKVEVTNSGGQTYLRPIANLIPVVQN
jgi:transposase InsO family protein